MDMIQTMYCDTFEEIEKGNQVTYEVMCTEAVHEYEQISNSNECSLSKKGESSNE